MGGERTMQRTDDVRGAVRSKRTPFLTSVTSTRLKRRTFRVKKAGGAAPQATATSAQDFALHGGRAAGRARRERRASSQGRIWAPAVCACAFRAPVCVQVCVRVLGASARARVRTSATGQGAGGEPDSKQVSSREPLAQPVMETPLRRDEGAWPGGTVGGRCPGEASTGVSGRGARAPWAGTLGGDMWTTRKPEARPAWLPRTQRT